MARTIELNGNNVSNIKKGTLVNQGGKTGKVCFIGKSEGIGFIMYSFILDSGDVLKQSKSTM